MITDFCWLHCLVAGRADVAKEISNSVIDEVEATEELPLWKTDHPSGHYFLGAGRENISFTNL